MLLRVHLIHALQQVTQKSLKEKLSLIRSHCLFLVLFSLLQEVDQKDLASFFCQKLFYLFSEFYCTWPYIEVFNKYKKLSLSCVRLIATPRTLAYQAPLPMELSRQDYWSGLPFPSSGNLPDQGSNLVLLHFRQILYHLSNQGS